MIGERFGMLTILSIGSNGSRRTARCRCDCGKEKIATLSDVRLGRSRSCGCQRGPRKANAEPLPAHLHRQHSQPTQQQRAGASSAQRQSLDDVWRDCVARADATLERVRQRVRWE